MTFVIETDSPINQPQLSSEDVSFPEIAIFERAIEGPLPGPKVMTCQFCKPLQNLSFEKYSLWNDAYIFKCLKCEKPVQLTLEEANKILKPLS